MVRGAPTNVLDYGADNTGLIDSHQAFVDALAASAYVYVPAGTYKMASTLSITGDKTLAGPQGSSSSHQVAILNFTGTGNGIAAISAEYGGVSIANFKIVGGAGADYAIYSTRPQSVIENIHIEGWDGNGIALEELGTGSQASWGTLVRQCKYIAPVAANPYIGFQVSINGGHVTLDGCEAIRGSIGINVDKGEAINLYRCSLNQQCNTTTYPNSSRPRTEQCGIRLSGAEAKIAVSIRNCYIEACTYGVYVETCSSLSINDNYIAMLGVNSDYVGVAGSEVCLKDQTTNVIQNVTLQNNAIWGSANDAYTLYIGENAENVVLLNNQIRATGGPPASTCIYKGDGTPTYFLATKYEINPFIGVTVYDPFGLMTNIA